MIYRKLIVGLMVLFFVACSVRVTPEQERQTSTSSQDDNTFYAVFERIGEPETKTYVNENLQVRWHADDRISIFNQNSYNQQYRFDGETGANAGSFTKVDGPEFVTGNPIEHIVSLYPYRASTTISEEEGLSVNLPTVQKYVENSFAPGINMMASVITRGEVLMYKNVCGYLKISLYGSGASVSSIKLKGNHGEKLSGNASVTMPLDGLPLVTMAEDASTEITLVCETPVSLGSADDECTDFWFVIPPVTFSEGFTVTITGSYGAFQQLSFTKTTSESIDIRRNIITKMSPVDVDFIIGFKDPVVKEICVENWDTNDDGELSYREAAAVTTLRKDSGNYSVFSNNSEIELFDEFRYFTGLSIIEPNAFICCGHLNITFPEGVTSIGSYAFGKCSFKDIPRIPSSVTRIDNNAFDSGHIAGTIRIPGNVEYVGSCAFSHCGGWSLYIEEGVKILGDWAFSPCSIEQPITLPSSLESIGRYAFHGCESLPAITVKATIPPTGATGMFNDTNNCPIYVPAESINAYLTADFWCDYADRIRCENIPVQDICIHESQIVLNVGETYTIVPTITPSNATYKDVTWSSSNESIATVSAAGVVTALGIGSATITVTTVDQGKTAMCNVSVSSSIPVPEAVDLGLSVKWASFNLGASKPEEYGDYFAWGELSPKRYYSWENYRFYAGSFLQTDEQGHYTGWIYSQSKYCTNSVWGSVDNKSKLEPSDDAAHVLLGGKWRIPTITECWELISKCSWRYIISESGEWLVIVKSNINGNTIIIPTSGFGIDESGKTEYRTGGTD